MKALYEVYDVKTDEVCGTLWLDADQRRQLGTQQYVQILGDSFDGRLMTLGPADLSSQETVTMFSVTLSIDMPRRGTGAWRIYCVDGQENIDRLRTYQEAKMRFPVPKALLPA